MPSNSSHKRAPMPRMCQANIRCAAPARMSIHATMMATAMPATGGSRMARIPATIIRMLSVMAQPTDFLASPLTVEALMVVSCPWVFFRLREIQLDPLRYSNHDDDRGGGERLAWRLTGADLGTWKIVAPCRPVTANIHLRYRRKAECFLCAQAFGTA